MFIRPYLQIYLYTLLLPSLGILQAQTVSTEPVGYITLTINGSPDGTTPAFTALSAGLQNAAVVTGSITSNATSAVLTDSTANNETNAYAATDAAGNSSYFIQITSGANEGLIFDILSNDAKTYTTGTDLNGIVSAGDTYAVKAHLTLADVFGAANETGLKSAGSPSDSDTIYLMSSTGNGLFATYYYLTDEFGFFNGDGWRSVTDFNTDYSNLVVGPDDGLIVRRIASGDLTTVVSGNVSTVDLKRDLPNGFSLVAYPFPVDVTLADSGIYSATNGYVSAGSSADSDIVYVIKPNGTFSSYYYLTDEFGFFSGDGWRTVADPNTPVDDTLIPTGSSIIIKHIGSGLAWADAIPF